MFCYNCGKQLLEGAKFCPYCGAKMTNSEPQNPPNIVEKRELSIEKSKNLINYFLKKAKEYNEYDKATAMLDKLSKGRTKILKSLSYTFLLFGGILLLFIIISAIPNFFTYSNDNRLIMFSGSTIMVLLIYGILFLCPGIVLMIVDYSLNQKYLRNLDFYSTRYFDLSNVLYLNYINYENCPIKAQYTNPNNIFAIQNTLLSGRADTINEAITFLSKSMYCNELRDYTKCVAAFAKEIAVENGKSEATSTLNVVFLLGNYFSKN